MGCIRMLAGEIEPRRAHPRPGLSQTGYCLASPGEEYVVYIPREYPSTIWVDLSGARGSLRAEWLNPVTGETVGEEKVEGGDTRVSKPRSWRRRF